MNFDGDFVGGQFAAAKLEQIKVGRGFDTSGYDNLRDRNHAEIRVRASEDSAEFHSRMRVENGLHLIGEELHSANRNGRAGASKESDKTLRVDFSDIACGKPPLVIQDFRAWLPGREIGIEAAGASQKKLRILELGLKRRLRKTDRCWAQIGRG